MKGKGFSMSACPFLTAPPPTCQAVENFISQCIFKQTLHPWFQRRWGGGGEKEQRKGVSDSGETGQADHVTTSICTIPLFHKLRVWSWAGIGSENCIVGMKPK